MKNDFAWVPEPIRETVRRAEDCNAEKWFEITSDWDEGTMVLALNLKKVGNDARKKILVEEKIIEQLENLEDDPDDTVALYFLSDESLRRIVSSFLN